jgi:alpha-tubulin suppressor-like RCC1 family protein
MGKWAGAMRTHVLGVLAVVLLAVGPATADSSSPKLAAYYDRQMAIVSGSVYAWKGDDPPGLIPIPARQVGVGRDSYYLLTQEDELIRFDEDLEQQAVLMQQVAQFAAGDSGVLAITHDRNLWWLSEDTKQFLARDVVDAAVGDGTNYYITVAGDLFVKGRAHRGQYGDGRLQSADRFVQTASNSSYVTAHTGHAILLLTNGEVVGTGGNIYGPVGIHGLGDKATRWGLIMSDAKAIATGSSHSVAIGQDGTLLTWGRGYDTEPMAILENVVAVAAGSRTTIALTQDDTLWQWARGREPRRLSLPSGK